MPGAVPGGGDVVGDVVGGDTLNSGSFVRLIVLQVRAMSGRLACSTADCDEASAGVAEPKAEPRG